MIIYTIYLLRQLIRNFFKGILYTRYQIATLNLIGQLILLTTIASLVIELISDILLDETARMNMHIDFSFGSFWFILAIGLFFIYLSKIFKNAKNLKEDNELTV